MLSGAGVANAHRPQHTGPVVHHTTILADTNQDSDNTGLWGLVGLRGLFGLAGLKRRNDTDVAAGPAGPGPSTPRV